MNDKLKIVHIVAYDNGGAAEAAKRISNALGNIGADSCVVSGVKADRDYSISNICRVIIGKMWSKLEFVNKEYIFSDAYKHKALWKIDKIKQADVIHLHWIAGTVNLSDISKYKQEGKKVVWTLHDMNPFTGGCHYNNLCEHYMDGCGDCAALSTNYSSKVVRDKKKCYENANICVIGCSKWITICAQKSFCMRNLRCDNIPNCIDTKLFRPYDKFKAREELGLSQEKKIILFGAMNALSDKRKGYKYLKEALSMLEDDRYELVVFGGIMEPSDLQIKSLGYIQDENLMIKAYSAADVFVAPSVQENLANTVMESMACGTPVVAFNIGGMPDMIINHSNGYLAQPFESKDLAKGIIECCDEPKYGINAREYTENNYNYEIIANKYLDVYSSLYK